MRRRLPAAAVIASVIFAPSFGSASSAPPAADPSWLAAVQKRIRESEYEASWRAGALQAPNRAQGLRSVFEDGRVRWRPRDAGGESPRWEATLSYRGVSVRGVVETPVRAVAPCADVARVVYEHERGVSEWFVNDERGLEHGFRIAARPRGAGRELAIELELGGTLRGTLRGALASDGLDLVDERGAHVLRYDGLRANDANGLALRSWMTVDGARLALHVDVARAAFPVTIDPIATAADVTFQSNQTNAHFGFAVATAGDVDGDGYSDILIGAPDYDSGQTDEGKVFLFLGGPNGPTTSASWTAESNVASSKFGYAVATAGDVNRDGFSDVIVGAPGWDAVAADAGAIFVWYGSQDGLGVNGTPQNADFAVQPTGAGDQFGYSVAAAGDVNADGFGDVVVGRPFRANGTATNAGEAIVYKGTAGGLTTSGAISIRFNGSGAKGGTSVSACDFNGDGYGDVIVGAPGISTAIVVFGPALAIDSGTWEAISGSTWLFGLSVSGAGDLNGDGYADVLVGDGFSHVAAFYGASGKPSTTAGWKATLGTGAVMVVSTAGDVNGDGYADVLVGSPSNRVGAGDAFVWFGGPNGVNDGVDGTLDNAPWHAAGATGSHFGTSVALAGDVNGDGFSDILVGAPRETTAATEAGRAYLFFGAGGVPSASVLTTAGQAKGGALSGWSVASAGDVNGDGFSDLVVGAPNYSASANEAGRVFVYMGGPGGLPTSAAWFSDGGQEGAHLGISVGSAGDVNGDGYDDVVLGADGFGGAGAVFVFHGSAQGVHGGQSANAIDAEFQVASPLAGSRFGASVAGAGDVNGDGYADIVVGQPDRTVTLAANAGAALVFLGSPSGLSSVPATIAPGTSGELFGFSVSGAGDVNGDGFSDVIVGAPGHAGFASGLGAAYVYLGSPKGVSTTEAWKVVGTDANQQVGTSVSSAGDVNADGFADVIVGAPGTLSAAGAASVYLGGASGLSTTPAQTYFGQNGAHVGEAVAGAGDVDGDGFSDMLIGAPRYSNGQTEEGAVFLVRGGKTLDPLAAFTFESNEAFAWLGQSVAGGGDFDGDGFSDVVVGAPFQNLLAADGGATYVFYGNGRHGRAKQMIQRNVGFGLMARYGNSFGTSFNVVVNGFSPFGTPANAAAQVETIPVGFPFSGNSTQVGNRVSDLFLPLSAKPQGLASGTPYHWRVRALFDLVTSPLQVHGSWATLPGHAPTETAFRTKLACKNRGDANANGVVDVSDVFFLINRLFAGGATAPAPCGDANGDQKIDVTDVFYLINFLFASGPAPF